MNSRLKRPFYAVLDIAYLDDHVPTGERENNIVVPAEATIPLLLAGWLAGWLSPDCIIGSIVLCWEDVYAA